MSQVKWFDRQFDFSTTQNIFPSILERLRGTPVRLEEKFRSKINSKAYEISDQEEEIRRVVFGGNNVH